MEMTDTEGKENQGHGTSDKRLSIDQHGQERRCSTQRGTTKTHQHDYRSSMFNAEGIEDFDEFVLDFDDYDLLESIQTQVETTIEPTSKFCIAASV